MRKTFIAGLAQAIRDEIEELTPEVEETPEPEMLGQIIQYRPKYLPEEGSMLDSSDRYGSREGVQAVELGAITYVPASTSDKIIADMRAKGLTVQRMGTSPTGVTPTAPAKRTVRRKTTAPKVRKLPKGGVGAKPRSAAEIALESERIKSETAAKTKPDMLTSTVDQFVKIGMIGIAGVVLVNVLPSLLDAMRPRKVN